MTHNDSDIRDVDIVVGVDGSPACLAALRWALAQARATGKRLHAVCVWELPPSYGWTPVPPSENIAVAAGKMLSESVRQALGPGSFDVDVLESVVCGHPAQVLIDASAHAALLVVGSRGHGGFAGALLGSVSQHCVQHAHCPVVVVRSDR
ncbi:universal stress protein [Paractinoplanes brasiliensis]|uniref:Nucleotide-binding universal stress UspA family protein n=1 Tax=Paractinoplanes brasiliensis TaxID=52695 RepID=A0A4R6JYW5_9ACTN|nr:universal stress protein [Actinoplanes brasiliensis]TDO41959.1 nucleotide-binding universal stress UspA family protein [Actinoplanes brasiliensis]GID29760.1 universal stress protein [Actinoplanes brasiliensis]